MKQYNISELMDSYTDNEFLIEGRSDSDAEAVIRRVMEKARPQKRLRLCFKILAAAALTAAVSVITAAALPAVVFKLSDGDTVIMEPNLIAIRSSVEEKSHDNIYKKEGGRVYFTFEGQNTDITDLISFDTAYYYWSELTDDQGTTHRRCIAVGGTPEHIGWAEAVWEGNEADGSHLRVISFNGSHCYYQYYVDGEVLSFWEWNEKYSSEYPMRDIKFNWVREIREKFEDFDKEHYDREELIWKYPLGWKGKKADDDIPKLANVFDGSYEIR